VDFLTTTTPKEDLMNKLSLSAAVLLALGLAQPAFARDTKLVLPVRDVLDSADAHGKIDGSVKFHFAGQKSPVVLEKLGGDVANRKTNAFNKSDEDACRWVMLSALIALQDKAKSLGANAVIDIQSFYKRNVFESATEYECHAGAMAAGVTLKGTYAKVK